MANDIGSAALTQLINWYRGNARRNKTEFGLSRKHFLKLVTKNCFYCGSSPSQILCKNGSMIRYNGLDRVKHKSGYIPRNVVPCCKACNFLKHQNSTEDFLSSVERVARYFLGLK